MRYVGRNITCQNNHIPFTVHFSPSLVLISKPHIPMMRSWSSWQRITTIYLLAHMADVTSTSFGRLALREKCTLWFPYRFDRLTQRISVVDVSITKYFGVNSGIWLPTMLENLAVIHTKNNSSVSFNLKQRQKSSIVLFCPLSMHPCCKRYNRPRAVPPPLNLALSTLSMTIKKH